MNDLVFPKATVHAMIVRSSYNLMGLGAPIKKDDAGFNKPDFAVMVNLLPSVSCKNYDEIDDEIFVFMANILVKYHRQIGEPTYSIIKQHAKTAPPYVALRERVTYRTVNEDLVNTVSAELKDDTVDIWFPYNQNVVSVVKTIPGVRGRKDNEKKFVWSFPLHQIEFAIEAIAPHMACEDLRDILEENFDEIDFLKASEENREYLRPMEIRCFAITDRLYLKFANVRVVRETVKNISGRLWHGKEEENDDMRFSWSIPMNEISSAYESLKNIGCNVDAMEEFIPKFDEFDAEDEKMGVMIDLDENYSNLFEHQKEGVAFLLKKSTAETVHLKGKILADDMGLGKTRQSIIAAHKEMLNVVEVGEIEGREVPEKILIICPASLKINWHREINMVFPFADVCVINSSGWDEDFVDEATWVVVNYDILKKYEDNIVSRRWAVVIADEAHYLKNRTAQRSKIFIGTKKKTPEDPKVHAGVMNASERVFLLTGTPVTSRPSDIYNLLRAVGHPLANNWRFFVERYCDAKPGFRGLDTSGASNLKELHDRIKNCVLRRTKEECLDMPEKIRRIIAAEVDLKAYRSHWLEYKRKVEEARGKFGRGEHLAELIKLKESAAIAKIPVTIEETENIIEAGEKVIIFTNFTSVVNALMDKFGKKAVKVVGGMSDSAKQFAVDQFQNNPNIQIFVGNIKAAGVGLTLTAATQEIMNDLSWVPVDHLQAEDRAYRIGQKNNVTVTYVSAVGTIDEMLSKMLVQKLNVVSNIMDGVDGADNELIDDLVNMLWGA